MISHVFPYYWDSSDGRSFGGRKASSKIYPDGSILVIRWHGYNIVNWDSQLLKEGARWVKYWILSTKIVCSGWSVSWKSSYLDWPKRRLSRGLRWSWVLSLFWFSTPEEPFLGLFPVASDWVSSSSLEASSVAKTEWLISLWLSQGLSDSDIGLGAHAPLLSDVPWSHKDWGTWPLFLFFETFLFFY